MNPPRSATMSSIAVLNLSGRFFFHMMAQPSISAWFTSMALMALPGDSLPSSWTGVRDMRERSISPPRPPSASMNELSRSRCILPASFCEGGLYTTLPYVKYDLPFVLGRRCRSLPSRGGSMPSAPALWSRKGRRKASPPFV